jgi:hypothetical protein
MGQLERARADAARIMSDKTNGFAVDITLVAPSEETATVPGLHTKHHLDVDTDGAMVSSKNAHISIRESLLTDLDYPVRNANGDVALKNHKVTVKDSTGNDCTYLISESFPNETLGLLICTLVTYNG